MSDYLVDGPHLLNISFYGLDLVLGLLSVEYGLVIHVNHIKLVFNTHAHRATR